MKVCKRKKKIYRFRHCDMLLSDRFFCYFTWLAAVVSAVYRKISRAEYFGPFVVADIFSFVCHLIYSAAHIERFVFKLFYNIAICVCLHYIIPENEKHQPW